MFFKNHTAEIKIVKDKSTSTPEETSAPTFSASDIGRVSDDIVYSVTVGFVMYKACNTLLRIVEHVVVTKVK